MKKFLTTVLLGALLLSAATAIARRGEKKSPRNRSMGITGHLGLVRGLDGIDDNVYTFGGDFIYGLRPSIPLEFGVDYWSHTESSSLIKLSMSELLFSGGGSYEFRPVPKAALRAGARLGYTQLTGKVSVGGSDIGGSNTESSLLLMILAGGDFFVTKAVAIGGSLRIPIIYFDSDFDDYDPQYFLLSVGYYFK